MPNSNLDRSNSNGITVINEFTAKPAKVPAMVPLAYGILCELKKTVKEAEL